LRVAYRHVCHGISRWLKVDSRSALGFV
jgi:hypothetical protein